MDDYTKYKNQLEYYEYFQKQLSNYTDLTQQPAKSIDNFCTNEVSTDTEFDPNDSVLEFAKILFGKSEKNIFHDLHGVIFDDQMDVSEVFCMLINLVLYGIDILVNQKGKNNQNYTIFDFEDSTDDIIYTIKSYLKSTGFNMTVRTEITEDDNNNYYLYRDRTDLFCEIVPKPPIYLCYKGWYVLNYRIIENNKFKYFNMTPLDEFKAFFKSKNNTIFIINFNFAS
jgi:hypothetical protein